MVEGAALEMLYTGNRIGGSNPPLSALVVGPAGWCGWGPGDPGGSVAELREFRARGLKGRGAEIR